MAVLDTGIDADQDGHGTHVAGTIFGQAAQGLRYGVAPGVRRALIGKVLGQQRSATTQELIDAIQWAVGQGAHAINMSLGFDFPGLVKWWADEGLEVDLVTSKALAQYRDKLRFFDRLVGLLRARAAHRREPTPGGLIVAAAGSESKRDVRPDYAIEVAPGVGVHSARKGGGYTWMSGTSMAGPHVSGVAALWAERQIRRRGIETTATRPFILERPPTRLQDDRDFRGVEQFQREADEDRVEAVVLEGKRPAIA